jgi:hypothetical protein
MWRGGKTLRPVASSRADVPVPVKAADNPR